MPLGRSTMMPFQRWLVTCDPDLSWRPPKRDDAVTNKNFVRSVAFRCISEPSGAGKSEIPVQRRLPAVLLLIEREVP